MEILAHVILVLPWFRGLFYNREEDRGNEPFYREASAKGAFTDLTDQSGAMLFHSPSLF